MIEKDLILKSIDNSGFPFELGCIERLRRLGFNVQPSLYFYDFIRNRNTEVDILATKVSSIKTNSDKDISCILTLAVECKKHTLPIVNFGVQNDYEEDLDNLDLDSFYCHINTSRDKSPNYFAFPVFDSNSTKIDVKKLHHHFSSNKRFYNITQIEKKENSDKSVYYKLHTTDDLKYTINKLGLYAFNFHKKWFTNIKSSKNNLEKIIPTPVINVLFLLLVNAAEQFQYDISSKNIISTNHSAIFSNVDLEKDSISFVIDLIKAEGLEKAIHKINQTYDIMIKHLVKWFIAQKNSQ